MLHCQSVMKSTIVMLAVVHTQLPQKHTTQTQPLSFARLQAQHGHPGMSGSSSVQRADLSIHGDVAQKSASLEEEWGGGQQKAKASSALHSMDAFSTSHFSIYDIISKEKEKEMY